MQKPAMIIDDNDPKEEGEQDYLKWLQEVQRHHSTNLTSYQQ